MNGNPFLLFYFLKVSVQFTWVFFNHIEFSSENIWFYKTLFQDVLNYEFNFFTRYTAIQIIYNIGWIVVILLLGGIDPYHINCQIYGYGEFL